MGCEDCKKVSQKDYDECLRDCYRQGWIPDWGIVMKSSLP